MIRYVTVLALSVLAPGAWAQNSPPQGGNQVGPNRSIENKAALMKPDDPNSVRALVDEVFNFPRVFPRLPSQLESTVKDRLVQAEILYQQGKKLGVQEGDVVSVLNDLADKFGAPAHAKTSPMQVRDLRMSLALSLPKFMGTGIARQGAAIGESISPTMGPLQAVHLMATLIDQKFHNPLFQATPEEWDQVSHQKFIDEVQASQERLGACLRIDFFETDPWCEGAHIGLSDTVHDL